MSDDARETLAALVRHLRRELRQSRNGLCVQDRPYPVVFAVTAIQGFLDGGYPSLDAAFGIAPPKRGRPKAAFRWNAAHFKAAEEALYMRIRGMSWIAIAKKMNWISDERELRRIYKRYLPAIGRAIAEEIGNSPKHGNSLDDGD
jgi:hypothetical protein